MERECHLSIQNLRHPLYILEKTRTFYLNSFVTFSRGVKSKNISVCPQLTAEQTKVHVRVLLTWSWLLSDPPVPSSTESPHGPSTGRRGCPSWEVTPSWHGESCPLQLGVHWPSSLSLPVRALEFQKQFSSVGRITVKSNPWFLRGRCRRMQKVGDVEGDMTPRVTLGGNSSPAPDG